MGFTFFLFPMVSSSEPFSVLPIIGYVVAALLVAYAVVRAHRFINGRKNAVALPKPVSGSAAKSAFSIGRATGWDWRRWSIALPWSRPAVQSKGKAAIVASSKKLTVELLPTTGLPPPPTSIPTVTPTAQLVDLTPATPPLTTSSSSGFPSSPRTPSPSRFLPLITSKNLQHSFPRPPSPHALLSTTSPQKHKRSRSLGGVPVRRLSGGHSSLRNKIDVEMHEFGHTRGTSREQLLIDFSSSGSSEEDAFAAEVDRLRISPAASDIGVLPVSTAYGKVVQPRPVPLVDLGDDTTYEDGLVKSRVDSDDEAWKWFGPSMPSSVRSYIPQPAPQRVQAWAATTTERVGALLSGHGKLAFPTPMVLPFQRAEKLVDVRSSDEDDQELVALDSSKTLVGFENNMSTKAGDSRPDFTRFHHEDRLIDITSTEESSHSLVDFRESVKGPAIDPFADDYAIEVEASGPEQSSNQLDSETSLLHSARASPLVVARHDDIFHHPLEELTQVNVKPLQAKPQPSGDIRPGLLFAEAESIQEVGQQMDIVQLEHEVEEPVSFLIADATVSPVLSPLSPEHAPILDFANDALKEDGPAPVSVQSTTETYAPKAWSWDSVEDPWGDHVVISEEHEAEMVAAPSSSNLDLDFAAELPIVDEEMVEKSPEGSLMPTVWAGEEDEEVPVLALEADMEIQVPVADAPRLDSDEEDVTPKAAPTSTELELPSLTIDIPSVTVPIIVLNDTEGKEQKEVYPDPELLPLPELLSSVDARLEEEIVEGSYQDRELSEKSKAPPSQMPTPPASPPPISPLRISPVSPRPSKLGKSLPSSPRLGSKKLAVGGELTKARSRPGSPRRLAVILPPTVESEEREDNATPLAVAKPLWAVAASERPKVEEEEEETPVEKAEEEKEEQSEVSTQDIQPSSSLPGSFPESAPAVSTAVVPSTSTTTIAARLAVSAAPALFRPSARDIIRSPLDIALAMQLRPGLGVGADPAWMVRFLMAMFGWLAVVVSGQGEF